MTGALPSTRPGMPGGTHRGSCCTSPTDAVATGPDRVGLDRPHAATILLVEDSAADAHLVRVALVDLPGLGGLHVARTGEEGLRFLQREGEHRDARIPDLVLLDLNLPGLDGRGVLARIRGDRDLHNIPVVVLTSSADPGDVRGAYEAGANCFVTKPLDLDEYLSTMRAVVQFWMAIGTRPAEVRD